MVSRDSRDPVVDVAPCAKTLLARAWMKRVKEYAGARRNSSNVRRNKTKQSRDERERH
jgi:hypothetical protein